MKPPQPLLKVLSGLACISLLPLVPVCAQEPAPGGASDPGQMPKNIREAYERAEKFGEEALPPGPPGSAAERKGTRRLDAVHMPGLAAGGLLLANLALGGAIFLGARRKRLALPRRKVMRKWHYVVGLTAVALALVHATGRFIQAGALSLDSPPAFLLTCAAVLLVGSGLLRVRPPRALARHPRIWAWAHRVLVLLTVVLLVLHLG